MEQFSLPRKLAAEFLGTALLLATVVGSGIMAERLAGGNAAIALLGNALANANGLIFSGGWDLGNVAGAICFVQKKYIRESAADIDADNCLISILIFWHRLVFSPHPIGCGTI